MTHEYNQAEADRFAPEYERQIKELIEENQELNRKNENQKSSLKTYIDELEFIKTYLSNAQKFKIATDKKAQTQ